ncbi:MAG: pantetheine-phosphate adenylyltransferase [Mycoplasmatales bacterium]
MKKIVFPGSFDPLTIGHLDIIERLAKTSNDYSNEIHIVVAKNAKKNSLFTTEEKLTSIKAATAHLPNVQVVAIEGLVVEYCREINCRIIARGVRTVHDFTSEQILNYSNKAIDDDIETIILFSKPEHIHVSSSGVRELINFKRSFDHLVPEFISKMIKEKLAKYI